MAKDYLIIDKYYIGLWSIRYYDIFDPSLCNIWIRRTSIDSLTVESLNYLFSHKTEYISHNYSVRGFLMESDLNSEGLFKWALQNNIEELYEGLLIKVLEL